jgi:hypothetical protein
MTYAARLLVLRMTNVMPTEKEANMSAVESQLKVGDRLSELRLALFGFAFGFCVIWAALYAVGQ